MDGETYTLLAAGALPQRGVPNDNFSYYLERGLSREARFLRVRITSGYQPQHWGLGEIEVFGLGATMIPDDDVHHVNVDVTGLQPGQELHYRLVAVDGAGETVGEDRRFVLPADARPWAVTLPAERTTQTTAQLRARMNALGNAVRVHFEYGLDASYGRSTVPVYHGQELSTRLVIANVAGLAPGTTYHYRVVAKNSVGISWGSDQQFTTAAGPTVPDGGAAPD
jgi:hypothetical protein